MSVDRIDTIFYGWKLPKNVRNADGGEFNFNDESYLPMVEGQPDEKFTMQRSEENDDILFGLFIARENRNYDSWDFYEINIKDINPYEVIQRYRELFFEGEPCEPKLFIHSTFN